MVKRRVRGEAEGRGDKNMDMPIGSIKCPPCNGTGKEWGIWLTKCSLCKGEGLLPDSRHDYPVCHFCDGNGRENGYLLVLCPECEGYGRRERKPVVADPLQSDMKIDELVNQLGVQDVIRDSEGPVSETRISIMQVEAGKPNTAHLELAELLKLLSGEVLVCDPYYGSGTLARLSEIANRVSIRVLTSKPDSKEKTFLGKRIEEFLKEYPHIAFRKNTSHDLHDRYIVTEQDLIFLGHGLKDIGRKESFVVRLDRSLAGDTIDSIRNSFDSKWKDAEPL